MSQLRFTPKCVRPATCRWCAIRIVAFPGSVNRAAGRAGNTTGHLCPIALLRSGPKGVSGGPTQDILESDSQLLESLLPDLMVGRCDGHRSGFPAAAGPDPARKRSDPTEPASLRAPDVQSASSRSVAAYRSCVRSAGPGSTFRSPVRIWPVPTVPVHGSRPAVKNTDNANVKIIGE